MPSPAPPALSNARHLLARHRRTVAALAAAGAVAAALTVLAPPAEPTVPVVTAARDLRSGAPLRADDLRRAEFRVGTVPDGALLERSTAVGRVLAGPVRRGEPITDLRLTGPDLLAAAGPGQVAVPVRIADAAAAALLRPGVSVDVLAAAEYVDLPAPGTGAARVVASAVHVLAVPRVGGRGREGAVVLLAVTEAQAARLAQAAGTARLSLALRAGNVRPPPAHSAPDLR